MLQSMVRTAPFFYFKQSNSIFKHTVDLLFLCPTSTWHRNEWPPESVAMCTLCAQDHQTLCEWDEFSVRKYFRFKTLSSFFPAECVTVSLIDEINWFWHQDGRCCFRSYFAFAFGEVVSPKAETNPMPKHSSRHFSVQHTHIACPFTTITMLDKYASDDS